MLLESKRWPIGGEESSRCISCFTSPVSEKPRWCWAKERVRPLRKLLSDIADAERGFGVGEGDGVAGAEMRGNDGR